MRAGGFGVSGAWVCRCGMACDLKTARIISAERTAMAHENRRIEEGLLDDPRVLDLLRLHLSEMRGASPPGFSHALDLSGLKQPDVRFFSVWEGEALLAIGALKRFTESDGAQCGEIKSMRTSAAHLRKGAASLLLDHMISTARADGMARLYLETGTGPVFDAAKALYASRGFQPCGPFAGYSETDFNRFMVRDVRLNLPERA